MRISLWSRLLDLVAPRLCCVCGRRLAMTEESLCTVCNLHLPRLGHTDTSFRDNIVARIFWGQVPVEKAYALFYYYPHSDTSKILYELKYHNCPEIGVDMGRLMADELLHQGFFNDIDLVIPLPLSKKRQKGRGYNQSEMIAKGISEVTKIPYNVKAVRRTEFKESQTRLNKWERLENVQGAFLLVNEEPLRGKYILLIDDVITTGATMIACAQAIQHVEGIKISFLSLALTKG